MSAVIPLGENHIVGVSGTGAELVGSSSRVNVEQAVNDRIITMIAQPPERGSACNKPCGRPADNRFTLWLYRILLKVTTNGSALTAHFRLRYGRSMSTPANSSSPSASGIPLSALTRLIRLQNQTGTYLLLLPTLWALLLAARGIPPPHLLAIFLAGSFLMRSAGVILNDLADQAFDGQVARTRTRPLASGELTRRHAITLLIILLMLAACLLLFLPPFVAWLAPVAIFLATLYPYCKRWIHVPQAMLGIAFGWGAVMAWGAVQGKLDVPAWCLFGATAAWAVAYDTIYAIQDQEDDRRIGVKSAALYFGPLIPQGVGIALGVMLTFLAAAGWLTQLGWPFYAALLGVGTFFLFQIRQLQGPVTPAHAFKMFRAHVWVGVAILLGLFGGLLH